LWFGLRRGREIYYEHAEPTKRITRLAKEKEKIWKEYEKARERGDDHKARALWENMRQIDADMEYERHKMRRAY
jgi:transposase